MPTRRALSEQPNFKWSIPFVCGDILHFNGKSTDMCCKRERGRVIGPMDTYIIRRMDDENDSTNAPRKKVESDEDTGR